MTRKIIGNLVSVFPFLAILALLVIWNWAIFVFVTCWVILVLDFVGWFFWFYEAGKKILEGENG